MINKKIAVNEAKTEQRNKLLALKEKALSGDKSKLVFPIPEVDYYSIFCKSIAENKMDKLFNCNVCVFYQEYDDSDAIIFIFGIPSFDKESSDIKEGKGLSQRVMEILKLAEEVFVTIDFMELKDVKEDKFSYFTLIKKVEGANTCR